MSHWVSHLLRSHNAFDFPADRKNPRRTSSSSRPSTAARKLSCSKSSLRLENHSVTMQGVKRLSQVLHSPKGSSTKASQQKNVILGLEIESSPLLMHGTTVSSSGALLSASLKLQINEDYTTFAEPLVLKLALEVKRKKPFHSHCEECTHQVTEMQRFTFMSGPATLRRGEHSYPFSFLLPGHLPSSMKGALTTIEYTLRASVTPKNGDAITLKHVLEVKRAVAPSETTRKSLRIFPPTNLKANVELPSVIHPIGTTTVSMRIDGSVKRNADTGLQTQWRLTRVTWRLEETEVAISPACPKHAAKAGNHEQKRGIRHQDTRTIGTKELEQGGWKADYSTPDGTIELEFPMSIRGDVKPICDVKAADGTEVSHKLVVEMIVSEELSHTQRPKQVSPTGAARVLRMHFNTILTQRSGLGISWDEETPPLYENVPASPPEYGMAVVEDYTGPPIPAYEDLSPLES
ncbi:hypothetical protein QTJ16_000145 [Diplocarpon rosae]|uniref:LDB19 N-terminal domain-containing protein n=1 Tax=Diplocarpon rosae TaxID=946125 RepID=A0AAD9WFE0_9HELO|nr:hypothetical protein QTJ16_000145 [Diplocarpon rosae]